MRRRRKTGGLVLLVLCGAIVAASRADVVYLKNGNSYRGTVLSRTETLVIVKVGGKEIKVPAEDVLLVSFDSPDQPESVVAEPGAADEMPDALSGLPVRPFTADDATLPDSIVFMLMRDMASSTGLSRQSLAEHVNRWKIAAHDRNRRTGPDWASPEQFAARRAAFAERLKQAQDLAKEARGSEWKDRSSQRMDRRKLLAAIARLNSAAPQWPDPLLREFLMGLVALKAEQYEVAAGRFRNCVQTAPRVPAFRQAYGRAMLELKRYATALTELTELLRLAPGSPEAMELLEEAMQKTPGGLIKDPAYVEARKLLDEYEARETRGYSRAGETWLMPGRPWSVSETLLLPTPPYDRLVFRQGVAVPVGESTLIVDARVLEGAEDIFIRLGPETLVAADRSGSSFGSSGRKKEPLALVRAEGVVFTPLKFERDTPPRAGQPVTLYGLSIYEEMGRAVRQIQTTVGKVGDDGTFEPADGLLAGEAAGPVISTDGRLLTFLAGKTDIEVEDGGKGLAIPPADFAKLIPRTSRGKSSYRTYGRAGRKKSAEPLAVTGRAFVVYATAVEKPE